MIANLPLLFANGHPTALCKITAAELERFVTFMVTCSWGHDTVKDIRQPPWWPADVEFSYPFRRTRAPGPGPGPAAAGHKLWENKLKRLVKRCYDYHKSAFLLVFSAQLARYARNKLRYVDNQDHTTSLYYKPSGKLLVTFRNENMYYDRQEDQPGSITPDLDATDSGIHLLNTSVPQPKYADIYLCDNCDSHFDNPDVLKAHERLCNNDVPSSLVSGGLPEFLSALKLKPVSEQHDVTDSNENEAKPRHSRSAANIDRGPPYPFSSLAYMRNAKTNMHRDSSFSRDRIERYCCTSSNPPGPASGKPGKSKNQQFPVRFRRPIGYWQRKHVFPYQRNKEILDLKGQLLLLKCRPIGVNIERMSQESMEEYIEKLKEEARVKAESCDDVEFIGGFCGDQLADLSAKPAGLLKHTDGEVIDLCSDDESPSVNENCDPRAGVTCVMRGGAVLRRTAATPLALPSEPCGARQKPLSPAILQPHPVILFTHSLSNFQTISLD